MSDVSLKHTNDREGRAGNAGRILDGYMSSEEVADELQVAVTTLSLWRTRREGPAYLKIGRRIFYSRFAVREWITGLIRNPGQRQQRRGKGAQ